MCCHEAAHLVAVNEDLLSLVFHVSYQGILSTSVYHMFLYLFL
jgi:hypothetical protein